MITNDEVLEATLGRTMSHTRELHGTSAAWFTSIAAPASPRAGRDQRDLADGPEASVSTAPEGKARPPGRARPGRIRANLDGAGRRRHRLERRRPAQGLVALPAALLARSAGRAAHAHVAQPLRDQQPEGQRPRGHEAPE